MTLPTESALHKVIELVTRANELLSEAEGIFYGELVGSFDDEGFTAATRFEEVLEGATHETASSLGLYLHDIKTLLPQIELRKEYPQLTNKEFSRIVSEEWSISLVKETQEKLKSRSQLELAEASELIKEIQHKGSKLPS